VEATPRKKSSAAAVDERARVMSGDEDRRRFAVVVVVVVVARGVRCCKRLSSISVLCASGRAIIGLDGSTALTGSVRCVPYQQSKASPGRECVDDESSMGFQSGFKPSEIK